MEKIQQTRCDRLRHLQFEPEVQIWSNNSIMRLLKAGFAFSNPPGRKNTLGQSRVMFWKQITHKLLSEKTTTKLTPNAPKQHSFSNIYTSQKSSNISQLACRAGTSQKITSWWSVKAPSACAHPTWQSTGTWCVGRSHFPKQTKKWLQQKIEKVAITFHKSKSILEVRVIIILGLKRLWSFRGYGKCLKWQRLNCVR